VIPAKEAKMKACSSHPLLIVSILILASASAQSSTSSPRANMDAAGEPVVHPLIGNPAAVYCRELGYEYEIVGDDGQKGICTLPDGEACDAWGFLQGKCGQGYSYCAQQGYEIRTAGDGKDPFSPEYAVCDTSEGAVIGSVTALSQLSEKATGCGAEIPGGETPPVSEKGDEYVPPLDEAALASFDWRSYQGSDWMTPIKDQGGCGSCWAFSAVGVSEAAHNIADNNPNLDKNLAEQYLVSDCSSSGNCCGGWHSSALQYIRDDGIPDESCMSYVDGGGCSCGGGTCDSNCMYRTGSSCSDRTCSNRCGDWSSRLEYIASTGYVSSNPQTIKQALVDIGPLAVAMGIGSDYGGYWDGDIYRCTSDSGANHSVAIVGYDDAGGYWWVRNSWGTGWGANGYFKLGYGECYVEQSVYYAVAASSVGDSYELDDTWDQANWIYDGSSQTHSIVPTGDVDWVKFSLSAQSEVVIETSGVSGDTRMWLYDTNLYELEYNDDGGSGWFSRIDRLCRVDALPAGTYYVRIDEYGNNDQIPGYNITFTVVQTCGDGFLIYLPLVQKNYP
jgi:C1A family cysteine protease